jgi:hypothetical protein
MAWSARLSSATSSCEQRGLGQKSRAPEPTAASASIWEMEKRQSNEDVNNCVTLLRVSPAIPQASAPGSDS